MKNMLIFSRRIDRAILVVLGIIALSFAPMLGVDCYKARKAAAEFKRLTALKLVVIQEVEAYHQATGHYPDSLDSLSFTNHHVTLRRSDLKKIRYRRTPSDYAVGWDGEYSWSR